LKRAGSGTIVSAPGCPPGRLGAPVRRSDLLFLVSEAEGITRAHQRVTFSHARRSWAPFHRARMPVTLQPLVEADHRGETSDLVAQLHQPAHGRMKNRAPLRTARRATRLRSGLLAGFPTSLTLALARRTAGHDQGLGRLLKVCQAEILSEASRTTIGQPFEIMVVKRLGPSLVPAEVVIPLASLAR